MGVRGLFSYIVEHKDKATERVDLAKEKNVVLLCDLPNVVSRLDQKILHSRVHSLPDVCGFYGGDLKLLAQQFNNFITALNHLGIKVIFVSDAPFGANEVDFREKLEEKNRRQLEKCQQIEDWSKWDSSRPKPYPLRCSLATEVCCKILLDRNEELVISHTEADRWIITHFEEKKAFGVLSDDSDFGVSHTCRLIPLGLFELQGFHDGSINPEPRSLICRYTDRRLLSRSLGILPDQITHLAIICGNDFTKSFNVYEDIGIYVRGKKGMQVIEEVSRWLQRNNFHTDATLKKKARIDWMYKRACEESDNFYGGRLIETKCTNKPCFLDRVQKHQLSPRFLAIENNRYWHEVLPEPPELCGKAHECTRKLRKVLYSLCGCPRIVESGKIQGKDVCEEIVKVESIPIYSAGCKHLPTMVAHLCQITAGKSLEVCAHEYPCTCDVNDRSLVKGAVIASTLNYVLSNYNPVAELDHTFIMSFLFAVATCSLNLSTDREILEMQRSVHIHRWINSSVVSLSVIFMAALPIVYNIARFLGLANYLPNMADIFSPAIFVHTMVQRLTTQYGNAVSLSPPQLLELNTFVADRSSTVTIRNLCLFVSQFENAVNFVRTELRPH